MFYENLSVMDREVTEALLQELNRQNDNIELIASENFVPESIMEAMGSAFTNKYAEGYPGKRYYGGCHNVDIVESLAIERAKSLFGPLRTSPMMPRTSDVSGRRHRPGASTSGKEPKLTKKRRKKVQASATEMRLSTKEAMPV